MGGLPNINISFTTAASTAVARSEKGIVAIILKDAAANGVHILTSTSQIPAALGANNKAYIARAFMGYVNPPRKVIVYVEPATAENLTEGLAAFSAQVFDYLVGPPDITAAECEAVAAWIAAQRALGNVPKAVLPNSASNSEAIINFAAAGIMIGTAEFTAAEYCSRIAGLIAGTPFSISCTYAPLTEVADIDRLTKAEMDAAIDAGKLILYYDGEKTKVARGVNSLTTLTDAKSASFQKIKIIEAVDLINHDIRMISQDSYIGKYSNTYDNKCVLIAAIKDYFKGLENSDILKKDASTVGIDVEAQEAWLKAAGTDTSDMTEAEIKAANTGSQVFLKATMSILDAIEDIALNITI
ncbi:MAG: phage tail sheath protein [Firmicutes bacterium HGW-Firmicutes-16]|nr:MAG: phage tail sheath protein [Firmicutes bacterium HGW-Firmicutes-16]